MTLFFLIFLMEFFVHETENVLSSNTFLEFDFLKTLGFDELSLDVDDRPNVNDPLLSSDVLEVDMIEKLSKISESEDDMLITSLYSCLTLLFLRSFLVTTTSLGANLFDLLLLNILFNLSFIEHLLEKADFSDNLATDSSFF